MEIWKEIVGYEALYLISNAGQVRSIKTNKTLTASTTKGYKHVSLTKKGISKTHRVHSLLLSAFVGPRPNGFITRHLDGNRSNNSLENLKWGTYKENAQDSILHGTFPMGENHGLCVLTNAQILEIYNSPEVGLHLAKKFKVYNSKISSIRRGEYFKSVTGGLPVKHCSLGKRNCDKLNYEKAADIRKRYNEGEHVNDICKLYKVDMSNIYRILRNEAWVK